MLLRLQDQPTFAVPDGEGNEGEGEGESQGESESEGEGDGGDAMDDDAVSVGSDRDSSVERGSKGGEFADDESSSCGDNMPGGWDAPDPPMPVTGFDSDPHFREQCDNQLGCYSSSNSEPGNEPDMSPGPSPEMSEPVEPTTREEKIRAFWKKYAVARSKHMEPAPKPAVSNLVPLPNSSVAPSHGSLVPVGSMPGLTSHANSDSDHLDSDTMRLSDTHRDSDHLDSDTMRLSDTQCLSLMKRRAIDDDSDDDVSGDSGTQVQAQEEEQEGGEEGESVQGQLQAFRCEERCLEKKGTTQDDKGCGVQVESEYKGYDITMLPLEARPDFTRPNLGSHSYTLSFNQATVEVLLAKQAYFVKKVNDAGSGPMGQISWSKHGGPVDSFVVAKSRSGLDRYATGASLD
eukprot:s3048_g4.t1